MISYQQERFDEVIDEIIPLLVSHWHEVGLNKDKMDLNPDYSKYKVFEDLGVIRIYTARDDEKLIGYLVMQVEVLLHYKDHTAARNDVIYIDPKYRNAGLATELIAFAEDKLKSQGVSVIYINTKAHKPFDSLLEASGFTLNDRLYGKYIGD